MEDAHGIGTRGSSCLPEPAVQIAHRGDQFLAGRAREGGGLLRREPLNGADDREEVASVVLRERRDAEARLVAAADAGDIAFLLQAMERAAHRCPAPT